MLGLAYLTFFILLGCGIANRLFAASVWKIRLWIGILTGLLGLMWCVVPFSFLLGFNQLSHILALLLMLLFYLAVVLGVREKGSLKPIWDDDLFFTFYAVILIAIVPSLLLVTHVLQPGSDGGLYCGQSTYGDLSLHLGIITSIATQGQFPPEYSIYPGQLLSYPFLVDSLSSSLYLFGLPLRWAILVPSFLLVFSLVLGFFIITQELLKSMKAAALACILFFFNGGFGFLYFMDGSLSNPANYTQIFTEFYHTPTNFPDKGLRWVNVICDMIIPQRTTLAGWTFILLAIWLLYRAICSGQRRYFIYAGVVAGLLPMIHTHSFLALGIISAVWMIGSYFMGQGGAKGVKEEVTEEGTEEGRAVGKQEAKAKIMCHFRNWATYGIIALALALPQLFTWTFPQSSQGSFVKLGLDWVNDNDFRLWFWIKNVGLVLILLIPALICAERRLLVFYSGAAVLFAVAELVVFQPNEYDNNKLFYIWFMFTVILVAGFVTEKVSRMEKRSLRWVTLAAVLFLSTYSGLLTLERERVSSYQLFSRSDVEVSEYIRKHTPPDAMFLTADNHNNAVASLTGRKIVSGTPIYLFFHGVGYDERARDVEIMFKDTGNFEGLAEKYKVDYVYLSSYERGKYGVNSDFFAANYPVAVFGNQEIYLFAVSERAKKYMKEAF